MPEAPSVRSLRLQLPEGWVTLPIGAYQVGRLASCQIVLDGPKVSRLHARIVVHEEGATVEDLGSANGVFVNGKRVARGRQALAQGDSLVIGDHALAVAYGAGASAEQKQTANADRPTLIGSVPPMGAPMTAPVTSKATALDLLSSVAERVLSAGDPRRAEGILEGRLKEILEGTRAGEFCEPDVRDRAIRLALSLAASLPAAKWVDYALDLLGTTRTIPSEAQTTQLVHVTTTIRYTDASKLRAYLAIARELPSSMDKLRALRELDALLTSMAGS